MLKASISSPPSNLRTVHSAVRGEINTSPSYTLTPRQKEVINALAQGIEIKDLPAALFVSIETIKTHIKGIKAGLNAKTLTAAGYKARALELVPPVNAEKMFHKLSRRELEVLTLMTQGKTGPEIAQALYIGIETVKSHVSNTKNKIGKMSKFALGIRSHEILQKEENKILRKVDVGAETVSANPIHQQIYPPPLTAG